MQAMIEILFDDSTPTVRLTIDKPYTMATMIEFCKYRVMEYTDKLNPTLLSHWSDLRITIHRKA